MKPLLALIGILLISAGCVAAHPVAQGAMEVRIDADGVTVHARVANEQVFVAEAFAAGGAPSQSLDALWKTHGEYLLQHLDVAADDTSLTGQLKGVTPPETTAATGRTIYELRWDFPEEKRRPSRVTLRQDVLNEIEYAPGNPWEATYLVRVWQESRLLSEGLLTSKNSVTANLDWTSATPADAAPPPSRSGLAGEYLHHGVMHILTGYDHLLFVAALVLAVATLGDLVKVVTAFTLAHTITLTLSVLDLVRLPSQIVEPMIAASIVVIALQNVFWPSRSRGWSRLGIAFGFGLFHGLGFAGGLLEAMAGMPGIAVATAIVAFSIGVELGHAVVVLPLFGALRIGRAMQSGEGGAERFRTAVQRVGSIAICLAGVVYLVAALRQWHPA